MFDKDNIQKLRKGTYLLPNPVGETARKCLDEIERLQTAKGALDTLKTAIQKDDSYAWTWHCNIAMPLQDEGIPHEQANRAAARLMDILFGVDITKTPQWEFLSRQWAETI